tara:strand:- start:191 stop:400 length:210 start_codon:yes stop_codon:yes gene_type:complete
MLPAAQEAAAVRTHVSSKGSATLSKASTARSSSASLQTLTPTDSAVAAFAVWSCRGGREPARWNQYGGM